MEPSKKELREEQEWEWMKWIGHVRYLFQWILMLIGASFFYDALHLLASKLGWVKPPGEISIIDAVGCAAFTGCILAELRWSDLKRKFETLKPGEDPTMI